MTSEYARSEGYRLFRSWVALQRVSIGNVTEKVWKYYDFGPKDKDPLICLPGASGTAEVFFKQIVSLCPKGYRIISVQFGTYDTHLDFCKGLDRFLDKLNVSKAHFFGTSLGGFLAQSYAKYRPSRVASMILNGAFCDTQFFHDNAPCAPMFSIMPEFMLKRILLANFPMSKLEAEIANSVDFMVEQLESLPGNELASRLILNTLLSDLKPGEITINQEAITLLETLDDVVLPENVREEVHKYYPNARVAQLKSGGNFPYLSRAEEVNMHIEVHLRKLGYVTGSDSESSSSTTQNSTSNGTSNLDDENENSSISTSPKFSNSNSPKQKSPERSSSPSDKALNDIQSTTTTTTRNDEGEEP
eukprot:TRINITY_DN6364_c0_g1_i1.p1 TRINITY_DN6364_c0_g1~~TRINITY_DN6364_c0_g1_i1.p1  ORF type:complete len:360 (+),score=74.21 TRINITY_DN6364_c0_g1_i1:199-1278(+)